MTSSTKHSSVTHTEDYENEVRQNVRILRRRAVEQVAGISRSLIYQLVKAGKFPRPVRLTPNRVGWLEHEVQEWVNARADLRKAG
jgi:prophage regulatory protein